MPQLVNQPGSLAWLGGTYRQELTRVPANSVALIDLGVSDQHWYGLPLPFDLTPIGMTGCRQLVSTEVVTALPTGTGTAVLTLGVPNDAALLGATFYTQAFALDAPANPFGGTMSNGLASRIGGR